MNFCPKCLKIFLMMILYFLLEAEKNKQNGGSDLSSSPEITCGCESCKEKKRMKKRVFLQKRMKKRMK